MSNMSYCRFQNTATDLDDCRDALDALVNCDDDASLSQEELRAAVRLVKTCAEIISLLAEVGDFGDGEDMLEFLGDFNGKLDDQIRGTLSRLNKDAIEADTESGDESDY